MIRDRITQLVTYLSRQIRVSVGSVVLGRETGAGSAQELTLDGLSITAGVLTVVGKQATLTNYSTISALTGYPASFTPSSHTHVSADVTDASSGGNGTANGGKLVKFGAYGSLGAYVTESNITAVSGGSVGGVGVIGLSENSHGGRFASAVGSYNALFGYDGASQSFVARSNGAFGWIRGAYTGGITAAGTLTANRTYTLPDASGTVALTSDINNANVVAAIEGDPAASRAALRVPTPILHNEAGLAKFFNAIMRTDEATAASPAVVGMTGFADSMPAYFGNMLAIDLSEKIGLAGLCNPEFGQSWNGASAAVALTGGAAVASSDYTDLPGANTVTVPVGGKYAITTPDIGSNPSLALWLGTGDLDEWAMSANRNTIALPKGFTKVSIYYEVAPGAGSITGTIKQAQLTDVTATASAAGTLGLGTMELTPTDAFGPMTVEVTSSTATVRMLGIVFWTGQSGVLYWSSAKGSTKMDDQLPGLVSGEWNAVYSALFAALNTQLVIHAQRASDAGTEANNHQANYATFFDAYDTLAASQLVLAEPSREPSPENALTTDTINSFLLAQCSSRGYTYFDRKALVPAISPFKDSPTDGIHRDPREHRFTVGFLLARLGDFAAAYSRQSGGMSQGRLADERFRLLATHRCRTRELIGQGGAAYLNTTHSGAPYGNGTVTADTGFNLVSAASTAGHSAATYGQMVAGASQLETSRHDIVVTANGYRNLNLPSGGGHRAALVFGQNSTIVTDITAITTRSFGVEFGHGTDIGGGLATAEYMRIFAHNGTAMTYSRWVLCNTADGTPSANGVGIVLHWDRLLQRFNLWGGGNIHSIFPRVSLSVPALASNNCNGAHVHGYIRATGTGHGAGKMQWQHISCSFGNLVMPYAV